MRKLTVAFGLIEQGDKYLLQLRGNNPMIGGAGLIGCFGGKVEPDEDPKMAACREVNEETNLTLSPEDLKPLGEVSVVSDHKLESVQVKAYIFETQISKTTEVVALEGELVVINKKDAHKYLDKMTTGTRACFEKYIN